MAFYELFLIFFANNIIEMQQKTLHALNSLTSEWRFENDELKYKIEKLEQEIAELKKSPEAEKLNDADKKAKNGTK